MADAMANLQVAQKAKRVVVRSGSARTGDFASQVVDINGPSTTKGFSSLQNICVYHSNPRRKRTETGTLLRYRRGERTVSSADMRLLLE